MDPSEDFVISRIIDPFCFVEVISRIIDPFYFVEVISKSI